MNQKEAATAVAKMNAFERAQYKHTKNKLRNDAYAEKQEEKKKPSVKKSSITITINDGRGEYTQTWDAPQLTGTIIAAQQTKEWYMQTAKNILQKSFGRLNCL